MLCLPASGCGHCCSPRLWNARCGAGLPGKRNCRDGAMPDRPIAREARSQPERSAALGPHWQADWRRRAPPEAGRAHGVAARRLLSRRRGAEKAADSRSGRRRGGGRVGASSLPRHIGRLGRRLEPPAAVEQDGWPINGAIRRSSFPFGYLAELTLRRCAGGHLFGAKEALDKPHTWPARGVVILLFERFSCQLLVRT
jgi:hypothetical protein